MKKSVKRFSNRKGTKIFFYEKEFMDGKLEEEFTVTARTRLNKKRFWGDSLVVDKEDITSVLDDYRVILIVLKRDKIAKRWFKREAGEIVVGINGERLKEFILPDGTFDEDKAWRVSQEGAEKLKSRI